MPAGSRTVRRLREALVWLLMGCLHLQGFAQSTLLQEPPFTASEPPPNVMLMFDDSGSMGGHRLPPPAWWTGAAPGQSTAIQGLGPDNAHVWAQRTWTIDVNDDFVLRAPALNPLWYNPAVRYLPWNKDGSMLPPASIGGSAAGTNHGSVTSRANPAELTERDPRAMFDGSVYRSVGAAAGRGLLGTVPGDPVDDTQLGRRVTAVSPPVDFRYHRLPYDFGPAPAGNPQAAHANQDWSTHHDVTSPLDLFSRPVVEIASAPNCTTTMVSVATPRTGCFASLGSCQANDAPISQTTTTQWTRQACDGTTQSFGSTNPGNLTCHRSRCPAGNQSAWTAWQAAPQSLTCDFQWTACDGNTQTSSSDPGPINCGWRRPACDGSFTGVGAVAGSPTDPGPQTCWQTRSCSAPVPAFGAWSTTSPGSVGSCWERSECNGTVQAYGANPGSLSCGFTRQDCAGNTQSFSTNPGSLACWSRNTCGGTSQIFTSDPGSLSCGWTRANCAGVAESFSSDPGSLVCYSRLNCDGSTSGPSATVLSALTCPRGDATPVTYSPTIVTRSAYAQVNNATSYTRNVSDQGTRSASPVSLVNSLTRMSIAPSTVSAVRLSQVDASQTYAPVPSTTSTCSSGVTACTASILTPQTTCTPPAVVAAIPNPLALTPARYYAYNGTGPRTDPASYAVVQIDRTRPATAPFAVVDAVTGVAPTVDTSQRTDCAARTSCTWVEEAQNYANWFLYYRNRMFAAQAVMSDSMSSLNSVSQQRIRLGFGRINYTVGATEAWRSQSGAVVSTLAAVDGFSNPGALVRGVRPFGFGTPERVQFFDWLHGLAWAGPTPNREALDSVGRYFSWTDDRGPWGATPGSVSNQPHLSCRRNFAFLTTDGDWTNYGVGQPTISSSGPLGGGGNPTTALRTIGPTITGSGVNASATFTYQPAEWPQFTGGAGDSSTLTDVTTYYWNRDLRPDLDNNLAPSLSGATPNPAFWQSMSTFVVGYGLSASMDTPVTRAAIISGDSVNWPTVDSSSAVASGGNRVNDSFRAAVASRGNFFAATSLAELRAGILGAFAQATAQQGSAGGIAVTGPVATAQSLAFFPSYVTGQWSGTLTAYNTSDLSTLAAGGAVSPVWTAGAPTHDLRRVFTSTAATTATEFAAANLSLTQTSQLTGPYWSAGELVSYLKGDRSLEVGAAGAGASAKFRRRTGSFADFVNSAPLFVRAPNYGYDAMPGIGASYGSYVAARRTAGAGTVYIGGNGGMLHAFASDTGQERFAYVPRGVYGDLASLSSPAYLHRYFVDGAVTAGDFHDGTSWRSVVVGTTGAGGASVFAIDTTQVTTPAANQVLWDLTKLDNPHIGHIMGRGTIGRIRTGTGPNDYRWVYINGNGYESSSNRAALLVIGLTDGAVTTIPVGPTWAAGDGLAARNGMAPPTVRFDVNRNITGVYAGDKLGNLWRFDFSAGIPTAASGFGTSTTPLFTATDALGNPQPITTAPRLVPHPSGGLMVTFGTGKLIDEEDRTSVSQQALYGIWEKPGLTATIAASNIQGLGATTAPDGSRSFAVTGLDASRAGWRFPLVAGERIVSDPSLELGQLTIASFRPNSIEDPCTGGGTSEVYRMDLSTGRTDIIRSPGMVGLLTPLLGLSSTQRTLNNANLGGALRSDGIVSALPPGGTPVSNAQCTHYGAAVQGRPSVIARACPAYSPLRVWRQPLR